MISRGLADDVGQRSSVRRRARNQLFWPPGKNCADGRRDEHDRRSEDDRDDAGHVTLSGMKVLVPPIMRRPTMRLGVLYRDAPLAGGDPDDADDHRQGDDHECYLRDQRHRAFEELGRCRPAPRDDADEDEDRHAVPMPRAVMSSPIHMTTRRARGEREEDERELRDGEVGQRVVGLEQEDVAHRLDGRQADREVAAVLGDDLLALLASFWSSSSLGMTTVRSCMMIDAVM